MLENVAFGTGSARLQAGSYVELDSIAKVLMANPALRVEIGGHTDVTASPADDMHLSTLRAEAVRNYLVTRGVPFQQVVARGYGGTRPRTPDTTPRGRAANRRIELASVCSQANDPGKGRLDQPSGRGISDATLPVEELGNARPDPYSVLRFPC